MKTKSSLLSAALGLSLYVQTVPAQLIIPSDGSDGSLIITSNTVIDLSLATTGSWDMNNSAHAGQGVYDPNKWAIVFKFQSISVPIHTNEQGTVVGHYVTFKNHPSHAPVVWLVHEQVT